MRAAVIHMLEGRKHLMVDDVETPVPGRGQVLVQVSHAGICGSDLHGFLDDDGTARSSGLIMGHETAGQIAALGEGVPEPAVGSRVTIDPQIVCGSCESCRAGWISICDNKQVTGSSLRGFRNGGMAEFITVDQNQVHTVPDTVSLAQAAAVEPLANALHVIKRAGDVASTVAVVIGAGPLGLCVTQGLRLSGATTVIASDVSTHRLTLAETLGADHGALPDDLPKLVDDITGGRGADVVVECVGIDETYQQALALVRKRGRVMFFGAVQDAVTVPLLSILHREITLIGCTGANDETPAAIEALASGSVTADPLITHTFPLTEADQAMRTLAEPNANAIKVQVTP